MKIKLPKFIKHRLVLFNLKKKTKEEIEVINQKYNLKDENEQRKLIKEFNLIQTKESNLSRKEREMVETKIRFLIQTEQLQVRLC